MGLGERFGAECDHLTTTIQGRASLDLQEFEEAARGEQWRRAAQAQFPGLTVHARGGPVPVGSLDGHAIGAGQLWRILSSPVSVNYRPPSSSAHSLSVMLQLRGSTIARQATRDCELEADDICLIDGIAPFQLEVEDEVSQFMFLQLPRQLVFSRYPYLEQRTARKFDAHEPGTALLRSMLKGVFDSASLFDPDQGMTALVTAASLVGLPRPPASDRIAEVNWRVRRALAFIEANLPDPALSASHVAAEQGISRRRLDELLLMNVGTSLNARIWARRMERAATDLRDARLSSRTVTGIGLSVGFTDAAHFTRAFKRQYQCTPREWRSRN
jgi:AraC-like DNA-binding protein